MTTAQKFIEATQGKYPRTDKYTSAMGPDCFAPAKVKREALVLYRITFKDESSCRVIMTSAQWHGVRRSNWWKLAKTIGGLGYQKLIS